jgi:hypothetical protein
MTTIERLQVFTTVTALSSLAAAGCVDRQPFDMSVVHSGSVSVDITHPTEGTAGLVGVGVSPAKDGGCYEVPADLRITVNGVPATSIGLYEETGGDAPESSCGQTEHTSIGATVAVADTTQPMIIDIAQGSDHAVIEVLPVPHPSLALTWDDTAEGSADGTPVYAELAPLSGDPGDVPTGDCWNGRLCPPGSNTPCASPFIDVEATPSSKGAQLAIRFFNESAGDRSLWVSGSTYPYCRLLMVSQCTGVATCQAQGDNYRDLLGPFPFHVR